MTDAKSYTFGELLRHHRRAAGLSQEALAEKAFLSARGIGALERGVSQAPRKDTLQLLLDALELAPEDRATLEAAARVRPPRASRIAPAPPALPAAVTYHLPPQQTSLVGREQDIAAVCALLRDPTVRLVTLTGPGGVGKTRLAARIAMEPWSIFRNGIWFVALSDVVDPELVAPTIARAVGIEEPADPENPESLWQELRDKQMLLVLDNFEQVVEAGGWLGRVLDLHQSIKLVVTSRVVLRLSAEHVYPVAPLTLPDSDDLPEPDELTRYEAVELFVQRARAADPTFAVTAANARDVAGICRRLDGLPLAIELAASRIRLLPPAAMLARLDRRLQVLAGGPRDRPTRHQTLRGTIDWSYSLLAPVEQRLFARLAVFAGGFTLEAAEALSTPGELDLDVLGGIASLEERSLLHSVESGYGGSRFDMLETIREYARERLEAAEDREEIEQRHADHYLMMVEASQSGLRGEDQQTWLEALDRDHDNVRAALRWALDYGRVNVGYRLASAAWLYWSLRGRLREGRRWLDAVLERQGGDPYARARALNSAGNLAADQGDLDRAGALYEEALELFRQTNDRAGIAGALGNLGNVVQEMGDYERATGLQEACLAMERELGNSSGVAGTLGNLGVLATIQGDDESASSLHEESLSLFRQIGDLWGVAAALTNLGHISRRRREHGQAERLYREGLSLYHELGERHNLAEGLEGLALVAAEQRDPERATRLLGAADALRAEIGVSLSPHEQTLHDRSVGDTRAAIPEGAWTMLWQWGTSVPLEEAIDLALR